MQVIQTTVKDALLLDPRVFGDARGFFLDSWNRRDFAALGLDVD
ncbi:MAG: dTDP-4-dehydrorhamnose 3,5-epimerase family protein, partial [Rhodocyclaceae bacterium]|nr:dTDP-4-dehydrorhamnose 3,5-epimerase family protein [Rhodocyclaceae bacterium]